MRAAFDVSVAAHSLGGVSRYVLSLAAALPGAARETGIGLVTVDVPASHPGAPGPPAALTLPDPPWMRVPFLRRIPIRRGWEGRSRGGRLARLTGATVYHHGGVQPVAPPGAVSVVTVYDLSALEHPEWHTPETVRFARVEERMVAEGALVAAISPWTARQAAARFGLPLDSVGIIGGAADDLFAPGEPSASALAPLGLQAGGYLLHVGNYVPRKNLPFLLDVYRSCREEGLRLPLVLAGAGGWGGVEIPPTDGAIVLRAVDDALLAELYRGARAVLVPSVCEGLGLPVLEALASGTAVIASSASALPETLGGYGLLLDPEDGAAWAEALMSLRDPGRAAALAALATEAPRPTWRECALRLSGFYLRAAAT